MLPAAFGHWQVGTQEVEIDFSATTAAQPEAESALWLSDLPAGVPEAQEALRRRQEKQDLAVRQLEMIPARMAQLADQVQTKISGGSSYAPAPLLELALPEADLLAEIERLREGSFSESYALSGLPAQGWQTGVAQFQRAIEPVHQLLNRLTQVETRVGGKVVGWTEINIRGGFSTLWNTPLVLMESELHFTAVRQALSSRVGLLKMLATAVQGALLIAAVVGAPGGAILFLPAVWKYVRAVVEG